MSLKVLLADDSMTAQNMGRKILSESGYDVTTVSNGAAAVKKIAEVKPDLVILDIYMPGYTGLEVCERVRANFDTANLPVLLTVGKMEPYRAEDGAKVRADGVIVKPFEATDLLAVVKKMVERVPVRSTRAVVQDESEPEETFVDPKPQAAAPQVDVPMEIAVAPALAMEEFSTGQAEVSAAPVMDWSAPVETPAPHVPSFESHAATSEVPWSFDQTAITEMPAVESAPEIGNGSLPEVEFNSAPKVGEVEVQQAAGLEPTVEDGPVNIEPVREESLASAQEITEFATSFTAPPPPAEPPVEIEEHQAFEAAAGSGWNGWAHADAGTSERAKPEGVIDDFEAKVAAAMSGFSTESVEPAHESAASEEVTQPVDDFEARVAAAMSGFATEPVVSSEASFAAEPEVAEAVPAVEQNVEQAAVAGDDFEARVAAAMSGFSTEPTEVHEVAEEAHLSFAAETPVVHAEVAAPASNDDFDARLAEAMSAFDKEPELAESAPVMKADETQEIEAPKPKINLDETMVLPQEAMLSLEEEMKRNLEQPVAAEPMQEFHAPEIMSAPESISWEPPKVDEVAVQSALQPVESAQAVVPETLGEFDPAQIGEELKSALAEQAQAPVEEHSNSASLLNTVTNAVGGEKLADAVHRAIDRLKPQLIAEIVKELKGE